MNAKSVEAVGGPTRFERRKERTRNELLAAAVRVLSARGFHDTKIADIAREADVGVGTFYLHFATKDALLDALVEDTVRRLKAAVDRGRLAATDAIDRVRRSNAEFCRFAQENREVFRIVFGHPAAYHDVVRHAQSLFATDIEESIRDGVAAGLFTALPIDVAAQALVGMATQILSWWTEHDAVSMKTLEDTMSTIALYGIVPRT